MPSAENNTGRSAIVNLTIMGTRVKGEIPVPAGATHPTALLPIFYNFADIVVDIAVEAARKHGHEVSCKKGCGACCRQLVPISEVEKHRLRAVVSSLPEPMQTEIRHRFTVALQMLESKHLLDSLLNITDLDAETRHALGHSYFRIGLPCPFLENESCLIHSERPTSCREYMVSSPAENCLHPTAENIEKIPIPSVASSTAAKIGIKAGEKPRIIPLALTMLETDSDAEMRLINAADEIEKAFHSIGSNK